MTSLTRQSPIRELFGGIVMPTDCHATAEVSAVTVAKAHAVRCWTAAHLGHRSAAVEPHKTPESVTTESGPAIASTETAMMLN